MGFEIVTGSTLAPGKMNVVNGPHDGRNYTLKAFQHLTDQPRARVGDLPWNRAVIVYQGDEIKHDSNKPPRPLQNHNNIFFSLSRYSEATKLAEQALARNKKVAPIPRFAKLFPARKIIKQPKSIAVSNS